MELPSQIREAMVAHARFTFPLEACGLLAADRSGRIRMCYCLTNAEASPTQFTVEPSEHFRALRHAETNGWRLAGVFHSHPHTAAYPSPTDRRLAYEPDWLYVIVSLADPRHPDIRAFRIRDGHVAEDTILVVEES